MNDETKELLAKIKGDDADYLRNYFNSGEAAKYTLTTKSLTIEPVLQDNPSLLSAAAYYGSIECLTFLLEDGASLSTLDKQSRSLQHFAVAGGHTTIIDFLASRNVDFSQCTHLAAGLGNLVILKHLINDLNCDPTTTDALGNSLLHNVAIGGDVKTAKFLIDFGQIDINCRDNSVFSCLFVCFWITIYGVLSHLIFIILLFTWLRCMEI